MSTREPCGCKHNGREWLFMCAPCKAEHDERHDMACADHIARQPDGTYLPEPTP